MEIRIYDDATVSLIGIIENQTSLIWTRRFFEPGEFKLTAPITKDNLELIQMNRIVSYKGAKEAGIIENIQLKKTAGESIIEASGRFLESLFDRYIVTTKGRNFSGDAIDIMQEIKTWSGNSGYSHIYMGTVQAETHTNITMQVTYKGVLAVLEKIGRATGNGFRVRPDFAARKYYFDIMTGYDRSASQTTNPRVEFSDRFDNIKQVEYRANNQNYKNFAWIGGDGEGQSRYYIPYNEEGTTGENNSTRSVFIDAKDIDRTDLSPGEYQAKLIDRAKQKLAEMKPSITIEATVDPNGNFKYREDYDLGDIVTVRFDEWGIRMDQRITEIMEVYEHEIAEIIPTFGEPLSTTLSND